MSNRITSGYMKHLAGYYRQADESGRWREAMDCRARAAEALADSVVAGDDPSPDEIHAYVVFDRLTRLHSLAYRQARAAAAWERLNAKWETVGMFGREPSSDLS